MENTLLRKDKNQNLSNWRYIWLLYGTLLILACVFNFLFEDEFLRVAGSAISLIICGLIFAFFSDAKFDMFSPAFFWGMNFSVFYGVAALLPLMVPPDPGGYQNVFSLGRPFYPEAILASLFCALFFFAGYKNRLAERQGKNNTWLAGKSGSDYKVRVLWLITFSMGVAAFLILIAGGGYNQVTDEIKAPIFYSAAGFLQMGLFVSVPLAVARALESRGKGFWRSAAIVSVGVTFLFGLPSGSKTLALLGLMFFAFAWNYRGLRFTRKQAWISILFVLVMLLALMPFNAVYRDVLLMYSRPGHDSLQDNIAMMKEAIAILQRMDLDTIIESSIAYTSQRLSSVSIIAIILNYQNIFGELALGETYFRVLYILIPRFIWLEKPPISIGREAAVKLGLGDSAGIVLGVEMSNTSVGLTFIGEAIYNFSVYLAPVFLYFMGMFYRWLYEAIGGNSLKKDALSVGLSGFLWYTLIFTAHESNFAAVFGGAIKFVIFLALLKLLLKFGKNQKL